MFGIKKIQVYNFRNIPHLKLDFGTNRIAFVGPNGVGKTNILNAMYYSTYAKVYRSGVADVLNIANGQKEMSVMVDFELGGVLSSASIELDTKGKRLYLQEVIARRITDFIVDRHMVMVTPDDILIINGGSENRRSYLDALLSKLFPSYLETLLKHNKYLKSRNAYLKQRKGMTVDEAYIDSIDKSFAPLMQEIYVTRAEIFKSLEKEINAVYQSIAQRDDYIAIDYRSPLQETSAEELLFQNRYTDFHKTRTSQGVHRDDLVLSINEKGAKDFASQGQKKTLLFAMKIAEAELISKHQAYAPILMIDDIFEKLDNQRIENLLGLIEGRQLFITDTSEERVRSVLGSEAQIVALT